jgi:hypothetical protein
MFVFFLFLLLFLFLEEDNNTIRDLGEKAEIYI